MLFLIIISVPVWINVQVVSGHSNQTSAALKQERERGFGGDFELAGFRNGAPFYTDVKEELFIYYHQSKAWHMTKSNNFKEDDGEYHMRFPTSGWFS